MTDAEIDEMQNDINREAGLDVDDGGVDVPSGSDGITRYPSVDGVPIPAADIDAYDGSSDGQVTDPEKKGEN